MIDNLQFEALKNEFKQLLLSTNRRNVDVVINWLENNSDFFVAPSSANYHSNFQHGLLYHSMNVYRLAKDILNNITKYKPDIAETISDDNIIISALLHDMCKVNFYKPSTKWRKNEQDQWEEYPTYVINDAFSFGHGEKSVLLLQMLGLEMKPQEMLAIRWHMGTWDGGLLSNDTKFSYNKSVEENPLCVIIQAADNMSSLILETKQNY